MLCYKDMAFCCTADCPITECKRHLSQLEGVQLDLPVSISDFGMSCSKYAGYKSNSENEKNEKTE